MKELLTAAELVTVTERIAACRDPTLVCCRSERERDDLADYYGDPPTQPGPLARFP